MAQSFDLVIRGGTIFDGTGAPGREADITVSDDRIMKIGKIAETGGQATWEQAADRVDHQGTVARYGGSRWSP